MLKSHLRLVACFFAYCALLAFGLNALLLLEQATARELRQSHTLVADDGPSFEWISREQVDDTVASAEAHSASEFLATLRLEEIPPAEASFSFPEDFSDSPSLLLSRPPPVL